MSTPFPGMDPYLEAGHIWKQVHSDLISAVRQYLVPILRPHYRVSIEEMTYLSVLPPKERRGGEPDVLMINPHRKRNWDGHGMPTGTQTVPIATATEVASPKVKSVHVKLPFPKKVKHKYLEIQKANNGEVITVIEIISPSNKISKGRRVYRKKRLKILDSLTSLIEIDLIRRGKPHTMDTKKKSDYRIIISRFDDRPMAEAYLFGMRDTIPDVPIPLQENEPKPLLPLNQIIHTLYDNCGYDMFIDYSKSPPLPSLSEEDITWVKYEVLQRIKK